MPDQSDYPGALDSFVDPTDADTLDDPPHDVTHRKTHRTLEAIQGELGLNPRGTYSTVRERLDVVDEHLDPIVEVVLGSATATVNLPCPAGTFRSLRVIARCRPTDNATQIIMRLNGVTGIDYINSTLEFNGTTPTLFDGGDDSLYIGTGFINYANLDITIPDKQNSQRGGIVGQFRSQQGANVISAMVGGRLLTNVDITEVRLIAVGSTFQAGEVFSLYGIR